MEVPSLVPHLAVPTAPAVARRGARLQAHAAVESSRSLFAGPICSPPFLGAGAVCISTARGFLALAATRKAVKTKRRRPAGLGFNMKKVSDEPVKDYDSGPKLFEIVKYPHPSLRRPNEEVTEFGPKLQQLSKNLFRTMYKRDDGCGLAAPQCGVNLRVMVYNYLRTLESIDPSGATVFVNPKITARSDEQDEDVEGCLSFPGFGAPVVRPIWVEVEAVDLEGQPYKKRLEGEEARIFQHEYDHLDGVVYIDHVTKEDLKQIEPNLKKLMSEYTAGGGKDPKP